MQTNVHQPDLDNFLEVLGLYAKEINDPYLIGSVHELKIRLVDNEDGFKEKLTAYGIEIGRAITFGERRS